MTNKKLIAELRSHVESAADCGFIHNVSIDGRLLASLLDQLEVAEARNAELEVKSEEVNGWYVKMKNRMLAAEARLAKLKGDAVPFAWARKLVRLSDNHTERWKITQTLAENTEGIIYRNEVIPLFTHPQPVPVVMLPKSERLDGNGYGYYLDMHDVFTALEAAGINFKSDDGEGE